jgi:hypothetical protein
MIPTPPLFGGYAPLWNYQGTEVLDPYERVRRDLELFLRSNYIIHQDPDFDNTRAS